MLLHEPRGYTPVTNQPWNTLASQGWEHLDRSSGSRIVPDPSAPVSAPQVLEHGYPEGYVGGGEPAVDWIKVEGRRIYVSMQMKVSDPWTNHRSHVNKIWFVWLGESADDWVGQFDLQFLPTEGGRWHFRMAPGRPGHDWSWVTQNVSDETFALGEWVHVETLIEHVTGERWHVRWWVNGVLATDDPNVPQSDAPIDQFEIAPTLLPLSFARSSGASSGATGPGLTLRLPLPPGRAAPGRRVGSVPRQPPGRSEYCSPLTRIRGA